MNQRQSIAFPEVGLVNKGTPKKKHTKDGREMWIQGSDLGDKFRLSLYPGVSPGIATALNQHTPALQAQHGMSLTPVTYGPNFATPQGWETTQIRAMLCFPTINESWWWGNTAYNSGIQIALADDEKFIFLRNPLNVREYLVKDALPHTPYTPGQKISYERNGKKYELPTKTEGRLRVLIPSLGRMVLFTLKTRSFYDRINIDSQMRGIQFMANTLNGGNAGGIPFFLYRRQEEHPWINDNGQATLQKKWHIQVELDRAWVATAMRRMTQFALTGESVKGLLAPVADTGQFPTEPIDGYVESDYGDEEEEPTHAPRPNAPLEITSPRCEVCGQVLPMHAPGCRIGKPAQPQQPQPAQTSRPYPAEIFKEKFAQMVTAIAEKNHLDEIGERERRLVAAVLDGIFNGQKTMRYEVCDWLTGAASTKDLSKAQVKALLKILDVGDFEDAPRSEAMQEFRWAHEAALIAKGQLKMPGMENQP